MKLCVFCIKQNCLFTCYYLMERILISCIVGNEHCDIQADLKKLPEQPGPCYSLSQNGKWLAYICKDEEGKYHSTSKSETLTQDDIDGIGEQIEIKLKG